jgi:hypothetical protein
MSESQSSLMRRNLVRLLILTRLSGKSRRASRGAEADPERRPMGAPGASKFACFSSPSSVDSRTSTWPICPISLTLKRSLTRPVMIEKRGRPKKTEAKQEKEPEPEKPADAPESGAESDQAQEVPTGAAGRRSRTCSPERGARGR